MLGGSGGFVPREAVRMLHAAGARAGGGEADGDENSNVQADEYMEHLREIDYYRFIEVIVVSNAACCFSVFSAWPLTRFSFRGGWYGICSQDDAPLHVGTPGMSALCGPLLERVGVEVVEEPVTNVEREEWASGMRVWRIEVGQ